MSAVKWLDVHVGGQRWGVYLVAERSKHLTGEDGTRHMGRCLYDKCRIFLAKTLDAEVLADTLLHELLHALLFVTGAEKAYRGNAKTEEKIVAALTPALHRLLKDLGFRFPRGLYK